MTVLKKEEAIIYRIIQEFINNSVKHAHAENLFIRLQKTNDSLNFLLADNGVGFDFKNVQKNNGLRTITQRLQVLQADSQWESHSSTGTSLTFTIYEKN